MLSRVTHMTILSEFFCVMNVWNQSCQTSVAKMDSNLRLFLQNCWQTIKCLVVQFVPNTSISWQFVSTLVIILKLIQIPPVWIDDHRNKDLKLCKIAPVSDCQLAISLNAFSSMPLNVLEPSHCFWVNLFPTWYFSVAPTEIRDSNIFCKSLNDFIRFAFTLSTSQIYVMKKKSSPRHLPHGNQMLLLSNHFYVIHVNRQE